MIFRRLMRNTRDFIEKANNPFPDAQKTIFAFNSAEDLAQWSTFSDSRLGGLSTAELNPSQTEPGTAVLGGNYSRQIPDGASELLKRSGFVGMTSIASPDVYIDLDDFDSLVFRVKGDGRKYLANLRTENWIVGEQSQDIWQAFLFARKNEWMEVEIPLERFFLTWKGRLVETKVEMNPARITSIGLSLAGGDELQKEGGYSIGVEWIAARNYMGLQSRDED